jgi:hypothetical protein
VRITNNETSHYAVFSSILLRIPFYVQIPSSESIDKNTELLVSLKVRNHVLHPYKTIVLFILICMFFVSSGKEVIMDRTAAAIA